MDSSERLPVSVTIISLNEESCLPRALESVQWASEVIVVDSGSVDRTVELARASGAKVVHNAWLGYGQQKNFAQTLCTQPWILNIDADEAVTPAFVRELRAQLSAHPEVHGFKMPRKTYFLGKWIRHGGWYPNVLSRITRKGHGRWTEPPVHEELIIQGPVLELTTPLEHFAFSSIDEQVHTNLRYAKLGSLRLSQKGQSPNLLKLLFKPLGKFFETYFIKLGLLDGLPGFLIAINAAYSVFLKYAFQFEPRIGPK